LGEGVNLSDMQWLLDLLPDWGWRNGFEVGRDFLNLLVGSLGVYLAYRAIQMGRIQTRLGEEQTRIGKEQTEIAKRQEALDIEQGKIAKRQAEIAETQHQIVQEQLGRKAVLGVAVKFMPEEDRPVWRLHVSNDGTKTAAECSWNIYIQEELENLVWIQKWDGNKLLLSSDRYDIEGRIFRPFYGELKKSIYPDSHVSCALIMVHPKVVTNPRMYFPLAIRWSIRAEDGRFPDAHGYGAFEIPDPASLGLY